MHRDVLITLYTTEFFLEWEIFHKKFIEKTKTHIVCFGFLYKFLYFYHQVHRDFLITLYIVEFFLEWEIFHKKKINRENQNKHCVFNIFPENLAVYEMMWKNMIELAKPQMIIQYSLCALHTG